ncbi:MAG: hypothetical protein RLZZ602_2043, partial [Pseudomonadota bacterium]
YGEVDVLEATGVGYVFIPRKLGSLRKGPQLILAIDHGVSSCLVHGWKRCWGRNSIAEFNRKMVLG